MCIRDRGETLPYLKANEDEFDIIVLDPPAFAKSMNANTKPYKDIKKSMNWPCERLKRMVSFLPILAHR